MFLCFLYMFLDCSVKHLQCSLRVFTSFKSFSVAFQINSGTNFLPFRSGFVSYYLIYEFLREFWRIEWRILRYTLQYFKIDLIWISFNQCVVIQQMPIKKIEINCSEKSDKVQTSKRRWPCYFSFHFIFIK